tara:strand:+ start:9085 stop:9753 length:669 start_codon:yes stop_codon:yes gene_type:complete
MRIDIITIFPDFFDSPFSHSIVKRAIEKKIVEIHTHDLRGFSKNNNVDDYQFGGGSGMVMSIEPIDSCIAKLKSERNYDEIIYLTPDSKKLTQKTCNELSLMKNIIILCGHYKGIDQRIRDNIITKEISIGDYVLTGGETAAIVLTDSIIRLIPGSISDITSALNDSFQDNLLSYPIYTRPSNYKGLKVPEILTSGNTKLINEWRDKKSLEITKKLRPDLLK